LQRRPKSVTRLVVRSSRPHPYRLAGVPHGRWFVHAVAMADTNEPEPWTRRHLLVGGGPVRIAAGTGTSAPISLRPRGLTDLPILLALPDLEAELVLQQAAYARPTMRRSGLS
jgi:AraC family transcriptional regulator